ncbi:hypothetical protein Dalk_5230 [Desulfatibacillum aliphaticivorans]|uniref:Uncharacterized protein n=1 Tax=Desulfatibacillum aliphaticivorans TaxID=218208 RepID=B8FEB9_DESAL|nr:hypothetical protein [Desulfatibacillum aliphaticivorans]ACL06900.1 hypothetical protein Dalk_5230 [Desulfatibacillum aliphaticivorans]
MQVPRDISRESLGGAPGTRVPQPITVNGRGEVSNAIGNLGKSVGSLADVLARRDVERREEEDERASFEASIAFDDFTRTAYHSMVNLRGADAIGIVDNAKKTFHEKIREIKSGLANPRQQKTFNTLAESHSGTILDKLATHEVKQEWQRKADTLDASLISKENKVRDLALEGSPEEAAAEMRLHLDMIERFYPGIDTTRDRNKAGNALLKAYLNEVVEKYPQEITQAAGIFEASFMEDGEEIGFNGRLPAEDMARLLARADQKMKLERDRNMKLVKQQVSQLAKDDLASLRNTGEGRPDALDTITALMGPEAAALHADDQRYAKKQFTVSRSLETATPAEAMRILDGLKPAPGEYGFARNQDFYDWAVSFHEKEMRQDIAEAKDEVEAIMQDDLASLLYTGKGVPGAVDTIRARIGDKTADQHAEKQAIALERYGAVQALKTATPEQANEILEALTPIAGAPGFAEDQDLFEYAVSTYQGIAKALTTDPAGYAASVLDEEDRTSEQIIEEQRRLGVPEHSVSVLPKAQAMSIVTALESSGNLADSMVALQQQYGPENWPIVYRDLVNAGLSPETQVLASMDMPEQATARKVIGEGVRTGEKAMKELLGSEANIISASIDDAVTEEMQEFNQTFLGGGYSRERFKQLEGYTRAVKLGIMAMVAKEGVEVKDAAKEVVSAVFNSQYEYPEINGYKFRVPVTYDQRLIERRAKFAVKKMSDNIQVLVPSAAYSEIPEERQKEVYVQSLRDSGYWVTNETETGLVMFNQLGEPVLFDNGDRYEILFENMVNPPIGIAFKVSGRTE